MTYYKPPEVSKEQIEVLAKARLEEVTGAKADSLVCDGNVRAEVGAVQRCVLTAGPTKIGVTVTVIAVNGDDVKFDVRADDHLMT